jgi:putative DNA primase/helicase
MRAIPEYESIASALDNDASLALDGPLEINDRVVLDRGSDLKPEPIQWLWKNWLARGKLHILAGAPGQGKTTISIALAATVSVGGRWPDGSQCEQGNILIWSGEDDAKDTLLPRLLAAGADREKCYFVSGTSVNGDVRSFDPSRDLPALEREANRIGGLSLIIVDPVVSAVTGDSHKNTEVRRDLQPVVDMGSRLNASVLGISHFSKGGAGSDPAMRVVGSVAFIAVARIVLVAAKVKSEEGEEDRRIFARAKSNIGPDDGGFEYIIDQTEPIPGIQASRILWGSPLNGTAKELLADPEKENNEGDDSKDAITLAMDFLLEVLADGLTPVKDVQKQARDNGIAPRTLRRAAERLQVIRKKGTGNAWYWKLPKANFKAGGNYSDEKVTSNLAKQVDQLVQPQERGHVGQVDRGNGNASMDGLDPASHVGQVGQDLNVGQVGQDDGQVELDSNDKVTI